MGSKNRVIANLKPVQKKLVKNYSEKNELSESKVVSIAVKQFFDAMPNEIKIKYLNYNKQMRE